MNRYIIILFLFSAFGCNCQTVKEYTSIIDALNNPDSVFILKIRNEKGENKFPSEIFLFRNLKKLTFTGMDCDIVDQACLNIRVIPEGICTLKKLEELYLVNNSLKEVPKCLNSLHIKILDLSDNQYINLDNIFNMLSLEELHLNGCQLKKISNKIKKLKNLKRIGLSNNNFSKNEIDYINKILPKCLIFWD